MASTSTHDVSLATLGGTAMGFMLARDRRGRKQYETFHLRGIPSRQTSDTELTYSQFPEQVQKIWAESNWLYGMGGIDRTDTLKIAEGYKIDGSIRGKLQLARQLKLSVTDGNAPNQYVSSGFVKSGVRMEAFIGDYPYTWDFTNKTWDRGTSLAGTTGPRMFRNGVEYAGSVYVPSWADDVGSGGLYTGSDEPFRYLYKTTGAAAWTQKAASTANPAFFKFLTAANSKLIGGYVGDAAANGATLDGNISASATTINESDTSPFTVGDIVQLDDELMLVVTINANVSIVVVRGYRGSVGATHSLGAAYNKITLNKHQIRTSTDGTTWSSATNIGDSTSPIVGMLGLDWGTSSYVYIFKTDGVYKYDFTNVDKIIPEVGGPTNGRASCVWNGKVYFSRNGGGLWQLNPDTDAYTDVSFSLVTPQQTQLHGEVVALTQDGESIFALVLDTTNTKYHLMQGFSVSGNASISWHHAGAVSYTTGTDANHVALYVDSVPNGSATRQRIQVGLNSTGGTQANYMPYHFFRDADEDDVFNPDDDGYTISIKQDYGMLLVPKRWHKVLITTDNLGSGANDHYMEFDYRIDGGSWEWFTTTLGGTQSQANSKLTADSTTLYFGIDEDGKACEIRAKFYQGTTTTTSPELHDFSVTAQIRLDTSIAFKMGLDVRDGVLLKTGRPQYNVAGQLSQLQTWKDQTDAITFTDLAGTSHTCIIDHDRYQELPLPQENGYRQGYLVTLVLYKVA